MPDLSPVNVTPYLTVIPQRRPQQKVHRTLGHAKAAVSTRYGPSVRENGRYVGTVPEAQIYVFGENHEWELLYDIPAGTRKDALPWN